MHERKVEQRPGALRSRRLQGWVRLGSLALTLLGGLALARPAWAQGEPLQDPVQRDLDWGDRALRQGARLQALGLYHRALTEAAPGDDRRTDALVRMATADATMSNCARATRWLDQAGQGALATDPTRAASRRGSYAQIQDFCEE